MKNKIHIKLFVNYIRYLKKVGLGKLLLNFFVQRIFFVNRHIKCSVHYTSTFVGNKLFYNKKDFSTLVSFASSGGLYVQSLNGIYIGDNILIGPGVKIISSNHSLDFDRKSIECRPIVIGSNVWIGANSIILPGVNIQDNCVIAAGSVVTKTFVGESLLLAGNPAKVIKTIKHEK